MKRLINILAFIALGVATLSAAMTAKSVLDSAAARFKSATALTAHFTITQPGLDDAASGHITLSGEKFAIVTDEMSSWYDGKLQWTYSPSINEVNIIEPTPDELRQVNPFSIINAFQNSFNYRLTDTAGGFYTVELTPKDKSDNIARAVIRFNASTSYPSEIKVTMTDRSVIVITVKDIKELKSVQPSTFVFNKNKFPGVEVIDLR